MVLESDVIGCKCLIEHGESLECDEQDACTQRVFLHSIMLQHMKIGQGQKALNFFQ
jgi:hypothetical protein